MMLKSREIISGNCISTVVLEMTIARSKYIDRAAWAAF
jgi:hypothetical protein